MAKFTFKAFKSKEGSSAGTYPTALRPPWPMHKHECNKEFDYMAKSFTGEVSSVTSFGFSYGVLRCIIFKHHLKASGSLISMANHLRIADAPNTEESQNPYQRRREQIRRAQKYVL